MAKLSVQTIERTGLKSTYAAAGSTGDSFSNTGRTFLHVKNGDTATHTVTVASQFFSPPAGTQKNDLAVAVPAGEERMIGPFPERAFNDANDLVQIAYDAVTSVTVAAIKF